MDFGQVGDFQQSGVGLDRIAEVDVECGDDAGLWGAQSYHGRRIAGLAAFHADDFGIGLDRFAEGGGEADHATGDAAAHGGGGSGAAFEAAEGEGRFLEEARLGRGEFEAQVGDGVGVEHDGVLFALRIGCGDERGGEKKIKRRREFHGNQSGMQQVADRRRTAARW